MQIRKNQKYSIHIECKDFDDDALNDNGSTFEFTGKELVHAILTCGVLNKLSQISAEFNYKKYSLECQFKEQNGELYLSNEYAYYDQSERNCLSYYRGMIFARLIAYKKFNLTHFVHLSNFVRNKKNGITKNISSGNLVPDIIAWNNNKLDYYVWECKGHKNALSHGKKQAETINAVNGNDVKMNIVSVVYPARKNKKIVAYVKDPVGEGERTEVDIDIDKCLAIYYDSVFRLIKDYFIADEDNMKLAEIEFGDEKIIIGLPIYVFDSLDKYNNESQNMRIPIENIMNEYSVDNFCKHKEDMFTDLIYIK